MAETKKAQSARSKAPKEPEDRKTSLDITGSRDPVDVNLVGVQYTVTPPKGIIALKFAKTAQNASKDPDKLIDSLVEWLNIAFDEKTAKEIENRLYEPNDDLDISHIIQLIQKLTEIVTGNPTT